MPEVATTVNFILIGAGLFLIFLEIVGGMDTMFDLVLAGFAMLIGGVVGFIAFNWWLGLLVATIITLSYWVWGRKVLKTRLFRTIHKSNADAVQDQQAKVFQILSTDRGLVRINGEEWTVDADTPLEVGDMVVVKEVKGSILKVDKIT